MGWSDSETHIPNVRKRGNDGLQYLSGHCLLAMLLGESEMTVKIMAYILVSHLAVLAVLYIAMTNMPVCVLF